MVGRTHSFTWSEGVVSEIVESVTAVVTLLVGYLVGRRTERHAWVWASSSRRERATGPDTLPGTDTRGSDGRRGSTRELECSPDAVIAAEPSEQPPNEALSDVDLSRQEFDGVCGRRSLESPLRVQGR